MKRLFLRFLLFSLLLLLMDRAIVMVLQSARPVDYESFLQAKSAIFAEDKPYEMLLVGDSHVSDALDPQILADSCGLSTFNAGIFLSSPYETYYSFKYLLEEKQQSPEVLVIGTNPVMFTLETDPGKYTPLVVNDPLFTLKMYARADNPDYTSFFFHTAKEKYLVKALLNKILGKSGKPYREIEDTYHGFLKMYNQIDGTVWDGVPWEAPETNYSQVRYFCKMIELAQKNGIETYIVNPPIWWTQLNTIDTTEGFKTFQHLIDSIGNQYQIPVHNLNHRFLADQLVFEDFLNHEHINYYGSLKYTPAIARWINSQRN